jgi:hypothetical protein
MLRLTQPGSALLNGAFLSHSVVFPFLGALAAAAVESASADEKVSRGEIGIRGEMDPEATKTGVVSRGRHVGHMGVATAELLEPFERELSG